MSGNRFVKEEFPRKSAHIAFFLPAFLLPFIPPHLALTLALIVALGNAFVLPRMLPQLFPAHRKGGGRLEAVHYPLAIAAFLIPSNIFSTSNWFLLPASAWYALAMLDGILGLTHASFKTGPLPWNPSKTWLGWIVGSSVASIPAGFLWNYFVSGEQLWLPILLSYGLGLVESIWFRVDDNFVNPFAATVLLALIPSPLTALVYENGNTWFRLDWMIPLVFGILTWITRKLTLGGSLLGWICASLLYRIHPGLFVLLSVFFLLGVGATVFRFQQKNHLGLSEKCQGRRGAAEVFGAAGIAAWIAAGLIASGRPFGSLAFLICAAPLVAKTMDTVSSEVGKALGGNTYTLWPLGQATPGIRGGISLYGTMAGVIAACLMCIPLMQLHWANGTQVAMMLGIALFANLAESLYSNWVTHNGWDDGIHPNVFLTLTAAILAVLVYA